MGDSLGRGRCPCAGGQTGGVRAHGELEDIIHGAEELEDGRTEELGKGDTLLAVCN